MLRFLLTFLILPLTCHASILTDVFCDRGLGISVRGGIAPSLFTDKETAQVVYGDGGILGINHIGNAPNYEKDPKFDDFFEMPYQVSAEITKCLTESTAMILEFNYVHANGTTHHFNSTYNGTNIANQEDRFAEKFENLNMYSGYIGCRHFLCETCPGAFVFVGSKFGLRYREDVKAKIEIDGTSYGTHKYFRHCTAVSAGVSLGLDFFIDCDWVVTLQGEAIATSNLMRAEPIKVTDSGVEKLLIQSDHNMVVSFPITLGIKIYL